MKFQGDDMTDLPFKDPAEKKTVTFDFSNEASTLISATVVASVASGRRDSAPAAILSGSPSISGANVLQFVAGGVSGTTYNLRCEATDVDGEIHVAVGLLPVKKAEQA